MSRDWKVTFITRDGCSRTARYEWNDGPPGTIALPIWPAGARRPDGERVYVKAQEDWVQHTLTYREKEPEKSKARPGWRDRWWFSWDYAEPLFPKDQWFERRVPFKPDIVKEPTTQEVKAYGLSSGGRTKILTDTIEIAKPNVWGRIEIPRDMLTGMRFSHFPKNVV